jgi:hypothetical protein
MPTNPLEKPTKGSGRRARRRGVKAKATRRTKRTQDAEARRAEAEHISHVRAACLARDGYCRLGGYLAGDCRGPSEWAHLHSHARAKTRGKPLHERHSTAWTLMLCKRHHEDYDQHRIDIRFPLGMQGRILVTKQGRHP